MTVWKLNKDNNVYLILSGEGKSDIGYCNNSTGCCEATEFSPRAMAIVVDQIIDLWLEKNRGYEFSCLDNQQVTYISESHLGDIKPSKEKKISLPGKRRSQETKYFYENARSLANFANEKKAVLSTDAHQAEVVAILFRDADGTASKGRGEYSAKRISMKNGFEKEGFSYGVAMIPKPKSEAWLLCATQDNPYISCSRLENASGNDKSPNSLKTQLDDAMSNLPDGTTIEDLLINKKIDINKINMPSFNEFRNELEHVLSTL